MAKMTAAGDPAGRLERATVEAREVIRELNGSLKDARAVLKELNQAVEDAVGERVDEQLRAKFDEVNTNLATIVNQASAKVAGSFQHMVGLFLGVKTVADVNDLRLLVQAAGLQKRDLAVEIGTALVGREDAGRPRFMVAETKPDAGEHGKWT